MKKNNDVTKQHDLSNFYYNLEKNIAMGGKLEDSSDEEKGEENERRSPSPDTKADRAKRKRERAEHEMQEAKRLKSLREEEKVKKMNELQEEFAKHQTEKEEVVDAKARFLERKRKKDEELALLRASQAEK